MKRLVTLSFYERHTSALIAAAILAGALLSGTLILRARVSARSTSVVCHKIHRLDVALETIVGQAQPTRRQLLQIAYYRSHPAELNAVLIRAHVAYGRQLELLRAADCTTTAR